MNDANYKSELVELHMILKWFFSPENSVCCSSLNVKIQIHIIRSFGFCKPFYFWGEVDITVL